MFTTEEIKSAKSMKSAVEMMRSNLLENDRWAVRALSAIYRNQTADEQANDETSEDNGIGFSGFDAPILSSFAKQVEDNRTLSSRQMEVLKKKIGKYSKQLILIANLR